MRRTYTRKKKSPKRNTGKWILLIFLTILLAIAVTIAVHPELIFRSDEISGQPQTHPQGSSTQVPEPTEESETKADSNVDSSIRIEPNKDLIVDLGNGLQVSDIGRYTGMYMEDGSDEVVSGVLMMVVTNLTDDDLQYARINIAAGEETAVFTLTTIPAGASVVVLESQRMAYDPTVDYSAISCEGVAWFQEPLSCCEDKLQIQSLNGALNITNISNEDISGEIVIYYKNSSSDMLYGGITYRVRLTDGLAAGEVRQIIADHFSSSGSTIMFVTCG